MFNWLYKQSELYKKQQQHETQLELERTQAEEKNELLEKEIESYKEDHFKTINEGNSCIIFDIDSELKTTVKSRINDEISMSLIDEGYITSEQSHDESAIQLAFILITNEVTEQIIDGINLDEN